MNPRTARCTDDGGAAIVEFALLLPFLALIFTGIIEFGSAYRVEDQIQHSLMSAGRVAGQQSNSRYADYETLRSLSSTLGSMVRSATIRRVIIYEAPASGRPPQDCLDVNPTGSKAGVAGLCNVYSNSQVQATSLANYATPTACSGSAWDSNWCPVTRQPQSERVGVYVELNYSTLTGVLPTTFRMSANTVYDIEPTPIGA